MDAASRRRGEGEIKVALVTQYPRHQTREIMPKIAVLGASFGGLTAALELKQLLGKKADITAVIMLSILLHTAR